MSGQPAGYDINATITAAQEGLEQLRARKAEKAAARRARAEQWDALLAAAVDHPQGRGARRRMLSRP